MVCVGSLAGWVKVKCWALSDMALLLGDRGVSLAMGELFPATLHNLP